MEENLAEMVNGGNEEIPGAVIKEAQAGMGDGILTFDKPEPENVPPIEKEVINEKTQMVPYGNQITILEEELQPKTEDDLILITDKLYKAATSGLVITYYHIGNTIDSFYQKSYGSGELKRIASRTGISLDTLHKAIRFAKKYSQEHLEVLLQGHFTISWNHIANNLSVAPDDLIETYKEAENPKTFHDSIMNFKKLNARNNRPTNEENQTPDASPLEGSNEPNEDRDRADSVESNSEGPQTLSEREPEPIHTADMENAEEIPPFDNSEEIEVLNDMLEDAKIEIETKDSLIQNQNAQIEELNVRIKDKDWIIEAMKREVDGMKKRLEEGTNKSDMLQCLEEMQTLLAG